MFNNCENALIRPGGLSYLHPATLSDRVDDIAPDLGRTQVKKRTVGVGLGYSSSVLRTATSASGKVRRASWITIEAVHPLPGIEEGGRELRRLLTGWADVRRAKSGENSLEDLSGREL